MGISFTDRTDALLSAEDKAAIFMQLTFPIMSLLSKTRQFDQTCDFVDRYIFDEKDWEVVVAREGGHESKISEKVYFMVDRIYHKIHENCANSLEYIHNFVYSIEDDQVRTASLEYFYTQIGGRPSVE